MLVSTNLNVTINSVNTQEDKKMVKVIYEGFFLDTESAAMLSQRATLEKKIENLHITTAFRPQESHEDYYGTEADFVVTGYGNNGQNEGVSCIVAKDSNNKMAQLTQEMGKMHITMSISEGAKPKDTVDLNFWNLFDTPTVHGVFGAFMSDGSIRFTAPKINSLEQCISEKFWRVETTTYRTGHSHCGSPYETSDGCGNCDGARCEFCKLVSYTEPEFSVYTGMIEEDFYPSKWEMQKEYPEFYKKLTTLEPWVAREIEQYPNFKKDTCLHDVEIWFLTNHGYPIRGNCPVEKLQKQVSEEQAHILNQFELWNHSTNGVQWCRRKVVEKLAEKVSWNYECFRDFCGTVKITDKNSRLLKVLPDAINAFCKKETDPKVAKSELVSILEQNDDWEDYRSHINIKDMMLKTLLINKQPTSREIVAFLDLVYIDLLPAAIECEAYELRWKA